LLLIVALAGYYYFSKHGGSTASATASPKAGGKKGGDGGTVPVIGAKARRGNIGVYYTNPGNVIPIYTDTIKSRVDGQLMKVYYTEGQMVKKGDPLVEIDPRPYQAAVDQAEGTLLRDQALLANARVDQARYETLVPQKAVPEQTLATQVALVHQYEGTVKNDQGVLDAAKVNLVYCHITADIDGLTGLRLVDPGNIVHATDTNGLVVITQIDPISVISTLAEDQLQPVLQRQIKGQALTVEAWDRSMTTKLATGKLSTIDNLIDQTTGTVRLRAIFDNKERELYPSQLVETKLLVQEKTGVVLVNTAAIQRNTNATFVFLVQPDSTVITRNVTLGTTEGDDSEITSGLAPGDVVVLTGADKLADGTHVNVQIPGEQPSGKQGASRAPAPGGKGK
jgi:multidrug efflux system membrane fusion protein